MNDSDSNEVWKPIPSTNGKLEASNLGRIRSMPKGTIRKPYTGGRYLSVSSYIDGTYKTLFVHQLVDEAFNGAHIPGLQINHEDGDRRNNCALNLLRVTPRENSIHAFRMGLRASISGDAHWRRRAVNQQGEK